MTNENQFPCCYWIFGSGKDWVASNLSAPAWCQTWRQSFIQNRQILCCLFIKHGQISLLQVTFLKNKNKTKYSFPIVNSLSWMQTIWETLSIFQNVLKNSQTEKDLMFGQILESWPNWEFFIIRFFVLISTNDICDLLNKWTIAVE